MDLLKTFFAAAVAPDWDDFGWMQDATIDTFKGILSTYGIDSGVPLILSGCDITVDQVAHEISSTAGYISLNGEVLKVDAHMISYTEAGGTIVWRVEETDDPSGAEQDSNGSTVQCYQNRRGKLVQPGVAPEVSFDEVQTLVDKLQELMNTQQLAASKWTKIASGSSYISGTGISVSAETMYYVVMGNTMVFNIELTLTALSDVVIWVDIKGATGYDIEQGTHAAFTVYKGTVIWPVIAESSWKSAGSNPNKLSVYGPGAMGNWGACAVRGQIILQVSKT